MWGEGACVARVYRYVSELYRQQAAAGDASAPTVCARSFKT